LWERGAALSDKIWNAKGEGYATNLSRTTQRISDRRFQRVRLFRRRIARDNIAIAADQEFREIPFDSRCTKQSTFGARQIAVEGMGVCAVDVDLGEHGKAHAIILFAELTDLAFASRLLLAELIAGKTQHGETVIAEFFVERFKARILRRESALARRVDDEKRFALIGGERNVAPIEAFCAVVVDRAQLAIRLLSRRSCCGW